MDHTAVSAVIKDIVTQLSGKLLVASSSANCLRKTISSPVIRVKDEIGVTDNSRLNRPFIDLNTKRDAEGRRAEVCKSPVIRLDEWTAFAHGKYGVGCRMSAAGEKPVEAAGQISGARIAPAHDW